MQPTTPPPVESVESEDESETSDESDESESEDFEPPKWTSLLLQFAGFVFSSATQQFLVSLSVSISASVLLSCSSGVRNRQVELCFSFQSV